MATTQPQPFRLNVSDAALEQLQQRLKLARLPDELEEAGWEYGAPLADVKRLVARWQNGFDWRKAEAQINELPQFTKDIAVEGFDTLNIHFVHSKSTVNGAIPLLIIHGCEFLHADWSSEEMCLYFGCLLVGPGHFYEVKKVLPLLTAKSPDHPSFHVVAISLPGYGLSEGPKKKGFHRLQYAEVSTCIQKVHP